MIGGAQPPSVELSASDRDGTVDGDPPAGDRPVRHHRIGLVGSLSPGAEGRVAADGRHPDPLGGRTHRLPRFTGRVRAAAGIEAP